MSNVFVLDREKRPLDPIHPGYARWLLSHQQAAVFRRYPFTIILREQRPDGATHPLRLKLDPGSKTSGLALVKDGNGEVVWAAEVTHRSQQIYKRLADRRTARRSRRQRKTRYRQVRVLNRSRKPGWLPPSLESRINNVTTWAARLRRLCPIGALSLELVKFDIHLLQNPDITGVEYQQGALAGYELREYLLEKWQRRCAYCQASGVPLQIEHLTPRARGGSNRASNLTLACERCNTAKGTQTATEFGYPALQAVAQAPLRDAAAVNATRWALYERLKATGLPVETGTGGRTKWNRTGQQRRQMCLMDASGFPRTKAKGGRLVRGFQTGDIVRASVPTGKRAGTHQGRVAVKANGAFTITTTGGNVLDISARYCVKVQGSDGYAYEIGLAFAM